ncbi:ATP-binding cassette domain-containing protein [Mangrovibacillus cuniculi]|uniref:Heme ABC transporter ATP-binding protein CcmA n=1 Tax=Mangrovibacillus cuniculi TaxID=2593652 RepID=A0A7S8HFK1_9BACI|nr:heme ABC transporter ATP-binding protein CcmA [Mangrovibacillus cuniculi]QPC46520.1 heme ABC transporter ATP-binding protein CcmA [Mangrovibacillus cuniculi]
MSLHLKKISKKSLSNHGCFPFNLPLIENFSELSITKPVTIFVGDNGTGKSTFLSGIANAAQCITVGEKEADSTSLGQALSLTWSARTKKGFYFRANEFSHYIKRLEEMKREAQEAIAEIKEQDRSQLEILPHARQLHDLKHFYGEGLEYRSHGESFLDLFHSRFQPNGLYVLDEPEGPLSPVKQLTLISMIKNMVEENGQFLIATHSPILMAIPGAEIFLLEEDRLVKKSYQELEHVTIIRDFLQSPERYLRYL